MSFSGRLFNGGAYYGTPFSGAGLIRGTVAPAWTPASLFAASEQGVWYDPSDLSTMFTDTAGTTPVTAAGQTVARINDKSGRGNHATQGTLAARPFYAVVPQTGRRNLLTYTEQFDDAVWLKANFGFIAANAETAPDGTTTADKLILTAAQTSTPQVSQSMTATSGAAYTLSVFVKAAEITTVSVIGGGALSGAGVRVNLTNGTLITTIAPGGLISHEITAAENGFYHIRLAVTASSTGAGTFLIRASNADGLAFLGNGTDGLYIWGAQLELGSTATAYQRVVSQYDVTEAGVPSLHYLSFDGTDDFLVTSTITPGIDKAQVFAGVRKLSDAVAGVIVETSTSWFSVNGAFSVTGGSREVDPSGREYAFSLRTTNFGFRAATLYAAPITSVLTVSYDTSVATNNGKILPRINGVTPTLSNAGAIPTGGNFLAYPLYIGRRSGSSLPFNGHIYSLIVRFGANLDTPTIQQTEAWVGGKTGINLNNLISQTIYDRFDTVLMDRTGDPILRRA